MTHARPETELLRKVVAFLYKTHLTWYFTGPDAYIAVLARAAHPYMLSLAKKKARYMGNRPGIPDICICDPPPAKEECHGSYIELKAKKNGLTKEQKKWRDELRSKGYHVGVVRDSLTNFKRHLAELGYVFPGSREIVRSLAEEESSKELCPSS